MLFSVQKVGFYYLIDGFQADAMIALPGGYGTFEELLEMITW